MVVIPLIIGHVDIDECSNPLLSNCSEYANCTNSDGGFECSCIPGFIGDGLNCTGYRTIDQIM